MTCSARRTGGNEGLRFDKFCDTWEESDCNGLKKPPATGHGQSGAGEWVGRFCGTVGDKERLAEAWTRRQAFLEAMGDRQRSGVFVSDWRFVSGLGRGHPVENGFAWHHSLGVPYLPGSSIKGALRAVRALWEGSIDERTVFGSEAPKVGATDETRVGGIIFLDALPIEPVELRADVMTPHYQPYHTAEGAAVFAPGDWFSPNPIPFLTVAAEQSFSFAFVARTTEDAQVLGWRSRASISRPLLKIRSWTGIAPTKSAAGWRPSPGSGRLQPAPSSSFGSRSAEMPARNGRSNCWSATPSTTTYGKSPKPLGFRLLEWRAREDSNS